MRGDPDVVQHLNTLLCKELSAVDQYVVQAAMLDDWGYGRLHAQFAHEADDERGHVQLLVQRILWLEGKPEVSARTPLAIGDDPKQMLENDLKYELEVAGLLNEGIRLSRERGDNGTRALLEGILRDTEEDHIFWLESQLHVIGQIGLQNYLAEQLKGGAADAGA